MRLLTVSSLNLQKADLDWRISGGWGGGWYHQQEKEIHVLYLQ
jgi:hypothetical protein